MSKIFQKVVGAMNKIEHNVLIVLVHFNIKVNDTHAAKYDKQMTSYQKWHYGFKYHPAQMNLCICRS
jgi:hypothetical protein